MKKKETIDLALILLWPIIAAIISFLLKPNAFVSVLLFLALPSIYLAFRGKEYAKKAIIFSAIASVPIMFIIDYIAHLTGMWIVPNTILPFKVFNFVTLEVILWAFFTFLFVIMFYEYFIDKHKTKKIWKPKMKYLTLVSLAIFITFLSLFLSNRSLLNIPYWYLVFGLTLLLLPFLIQLLRFPKVTSKFFLAGAYFFFLHSVYEITALKLGWWSFPGTMFIGWVSILNVSFPLEEVLFWFILLTLAILSFFEFFEDDEK